MPQFVVLYHEFQPDVMRDTHWDLMLQDAESLLTWALPSAPAAADDPRVCQRLNDHRIAYLDYEGPISENRGYVTRWDKGTYKWKSRSDSKLVLQLAGTKLHGELVLSLDRQVWSYWYEGRHRR